MEPTEKHYDSLRLLSDHPDADEDTSESGLYSRSTQVGRLWPSRIVKVTPWVTTAAFAILSLVFYLHIPKTTGGLGSYETAFDTDPVVGTIPLERVRFIGMPLFAANGTPLEAPIDETAPWPENLQYFGEPSPEIDANWKRLIGTRYFSVSEDEAVRVWGERRHEYINYQKGGYTAGLDVFHQLHCINALRKAFRRDYYPEMANVAVHGLKHVEHCLSILRQSVQCHGSTTLIPTKFVEQVGHNYIDSDQEHVCRSFTHLREYSSSRLEDGERYIERDKSFIDEDRKKLIDDFLTVIHED